VNKITDWNVEFLNCTIFQEHFLKCRNIAKKRAKFRCQKDSLPGQLGLTHLNIYFKDVFLTLKSHISDS
jgi:hypothetical protein